MTRYWSVVLLLYVCGVYYACEAYYTLYFVRLDADYL
jgi:hypothetical protein